jgi:hypothetical protein
MEKEALVSATPKPGINEAMVEKTDLVFPDAFAYKRMKKINKSVIRSARL